MTKDNNPQKSKKKKIFFWFIKYLSLSFILAFLVVVFLFIYYTRDLPRPEKFTERHFPQSTKIYDRTGKILLYEIYGEEKREVVLLSQIPEYLQKAAIAAEDAQFYHHIGIDPKAVLRAVLVNLRLKKPAQGASTITQQLIRSSFLTREKTLDRKIREVVLTLELERRYSKNQILEWYLNQVPFGENSYGIEAASQTYFRKSASQTSLSEAATLAALIRSPYYYSPYNPDGLKRLLGRRDFILEKMAEIGYITEEEKKIGRRRKIEIYRGFEPDKSSTFHSFCQRLSRGKIRIKPAIRGRAKGLHNPRLGSSELCRKNY